MAAPGPGVRDGRLVGRVVDADSRAGLAAAVAVVGRDVLWQGLTEDSGAFSVWLPQGTYRVTASRPGFLEQTRTVTVRAARETSTLLALRRSPSGVASGGPSTPPPRAPAAQPCPQPAMTSSGGRPPVGSGAYAGGSAGPAPGGALESAAGSGFGGGASGGGGSGGLSGSGTSGTGAGGTETSAPNSSSGSGSGSESTDGGAGGSVPAAPGSGPVVGLLEHRTTVLTRHGNAARVAWSDDGKTVFLANEEGTMSAVKIDAGDLLRPRIVATRKEVNFLWAASQRQGLLVFHPSLGDTMLAVSPQDFSVRWTRRVGQSHAVETDGTRIYLPVEGRPGALVVLSSDGRELARVGEPDGWWRVYSMVYDDSTRRLYVGAGDNPAEGYPGGVYIYDVSAGTPALLGKVGGPSWDIAARGVRLWRQTGRSIETWDVSDPATPRLVGTWYGQTETGPGGTPVRPQFGSMTVSRNASRLYAAYRSVTERGGHQVLDWHAGFMIFDVTGTAPVLLARQGWRTDVGYWVQPTSVALSPDQGVLAVSYWAFGVGLYRVVSDRVIDLGRVATTGEAHDVYVDNAGFLHVFANDDIQTIDPATGEHMGAYVTGTRLDGQWRPFKDGTIILPSARNGHGRYILRMRDGQVAFVTALGGPVTTWDEVFEDPYLYSAGSDGRLYVQRVGPFDPTSRRYPLQVLGSVQVGPGNALALTKHGNLLWTLGPDFGVAAVDVSDPSSPRLVFRDSFTFGVNGNHAGIVGARGRIYAGAGDLGVVIYSPATLRRTGAITGYNVNFLDTVGGDFLLVSNYWYASNPDGLYVYDLRTSPDAPVLTDWFPQPRGNANFRSRALGARVYRVPLYGVDVLDVK